MVSEISEGLKVEFALGLPVGGLYHNRVISRPYMCFPYFHSKDLMKYFFIWSPKCRVMTTFIPKNSKKALCVLKSAITLDHVMISSFFLSRYIKSYPFIRCQYQQFFCQWITPDSVPLEKMENKKKNIIRKKNRILDCCLTEKNAAVPVVESVGSVLFGRVSRDPVQPNFRCSNCPPSMLNLTVCPRSLVHSYIVSRHIKMEKTFGTYDYMYIFKGLPSHCNIFLCIFGLPTNHKI